MAYNQTIVAPEKSQGQIKKMLLGHGASNVQFGSAREPVRVEGFQASVAIDGRPYGIRIAVPVKEKSSQSAQEQEERRVWRVLYHHIKAIFEAADSGVIDIRELLLPYFVTKSGKTIGKQILDDLPRALEAPKALFIN
jgi:hypothetical protein